MKSTQPQDDTQGDKVSKFCSSESLVLQSTAICLQPLCCSAMTSLRDTARYAPLDMNGPDYGVLNSWKMVILEGVYEN